MSEGGQSNKHIAIEAEAKFEWYLVALCFTLLGLAVQTAKLGIVLTSDAFEVSGWVALLLSGLAGLYRLEWKAPAYNHFHEQSKAEQQASQIREVMLAGTESMYVEDDDEPVELAKMLAVLRKRAETQGAIAQKIVARGIWKYHVHRSLFIAGLVLLLVARGYPAIENACRTFGITRCQGAAEVSNQQSG